MGESVNAGAARPSVVCENLSLNDLVILGPKQKESLTVSRIHGELSDSVFGLRHGPNGQSPCFHGYFDRDRDRDPDRDPENDQDRENDRDRDQPIAETAAFMLFLRPGKLAADHLGVDDRSAANDNSGVIGKRFNLGKFAFLEGVGQPAVIRDPGGVHQDKLLRADLDQFAGQVVRDRANEVIAADAVRMTDRRNGLPLE